MPTIVTEEGYRFKIYPNDHAPAHVHVQKAENEARVRLEIIEVMSNEGFNHRELLKIRALIQKHRATLLAAWDMYHESR